MTSTEPSRADRRRPPDPAAPRGRRGAGRPSTTSAAPRRSTTLLAERGEQVGLATVYRTLQALADAGEVDVLRTEDGEAHLPPLLRPPTTTTWSAAPAARTVEVEGPAVERWTRASPPSTGSPTSATPWRSSAPAPPAEPGVRSERHGRARMPRARRPTRSRDRQVRPPARADPRPRTCAPPRTSCPHAARSSARPSRRCATGCDVSSQAATLVLPATRPGVRRRVPGTGCRRYRPLSARSLRLRDDGPGDRTLERRRDGGAPRRRARRGPRSDPRRRRSAPSAADRERPRSTADAAPDVDGDPRAPRQPVYASMPGVIKPARAASPDRASARHELMRTPAYVPAVQRARTPSDPRMPSTLASGSGRSGRRPPPVAAVAAGVGLDGAPTGPGGRRRARARR